MFAFDELCVLLDVENTGVLSVFPLPAEVAAFLGDARPVRSGAEIVEARGNLRFRAGLLRLYEPPNANLRGTVWRCGLDIDGFAEGSIWKHLSDYISSYLDDTLPRSPKREGRHGFRRYRGDGVVVDLHARPPSQDDPQERGLILLEITRDEPRLSTIRRILGLPDGAELTGDPSCGTTLPSRWDLRLTVGVVDAEVRVQWSAPMRAGGHFASDAARCTDSVRAFLDHLFDHGHAVGAGVTGWQGPGEAAGVTVRSAGDERRHTGELRMPVGW